MDPSCQFEDGGGIGGPNIQFTDSTQIDGSVTDNAGQPISAMQTSGQWVYRTADLSAFTGKTISAYQVVTDPSTTAGNYDIYYGDIAIVSTNGAVTSIYDGQQGSTLTNVWNQGQTNLSAVEEKSEQTGDAEQPSNVTAFYHGDQVGSTTLVTAAGGWPVSWDRFTPYGVEDSGVPVDPNHYKFTGKERDAESGLDNFGARYYWATMGRFLSPDWAAQEEPVPYAVLDDPQSLNLYAYVRNNPLSRVDADGHTCNEYLHFANLCDPQPPSLSSTAMELTAAAGVAANTPKAQQQISARDKAYLDKYYKPVAAKAKDYGVDPALPLGLGIESGFATKGTYKRTGDAFGMTGGSTKHMTHAKSAEQNVDQLFGTFGEQMRGTGSNISLFLNHLEMEDAQGNQITSQGMYNSVEIPPTAWKALITSGIKEMQRDIPIYVSP